MVTPGLLFTVYYGFDQWLVVRFVIKKVFVYLFLVKLYIFSYTDVLHIFIFYDLGINLQIFLYFRIFADPTCDVNYKRKQNSEEIQRVKIRLNLKANCKSLTTAAIFCTLTLHSHVRKP